MEKIKMKINHHKILNTNHNLELHFVINIPFGDAVKYGDDVFEKAAEEFVKYAKEIQRNKWHNLESIECEKCLSKSVPLIIESEKYIKDK